MSINESQAFLRDLDRKLWTAADKLRSSLDAAVYKHAVLGLIFLKYVSDAFTVRQKEIESQLRDPESDYFLDPADYDDADAYEAATHDELEDRDYYVEKNVFWVPALARWKLLQDSAKLPQGTEMEVKNGKSFTYKISSTGKLIDDALDAIEKENPRLKNVLNKTYTQLQIDQSNLAGLIDFIATIPFKHADLHAKDILGHVYEYFLGQFALAEGKKGGQYFTPKSIVSLIVEMLEPYQGRVYDPAMGSGGLFVQSEKFIEEHGDKVGQLSAYGQGTNSTTCLDFTTEYLKNIARTFTPWKRGPIPLDVRGEAFAAGDIPDDASAVITSFPASANSQHLKKLKTPVTPSPSDTMSAPMMANTSKSRLGILTSQFLAFKSR